MSENTNQYINEVEEDWKDYYPGATYYNDYEDEPYYDEQGFEWDYLDIPFIQEESDEDLM